MELEPGRCRRTDGKKWRCSKDVVPDHKYCERHMHRGSRKHVEASRLSNTRITTTTPKDTINDSGNSNTNLSISIPANPRLMTTITTTTNRTMNNHSNTNGGGASPTLNLSQKSVLHGRTFLGSSSLCINSTNRMETEPTRCRRTDGRKWRCIKDEISDQKYCERHMHRGSRKHVEASHSTITVVATPITTTFNPVDAASTDSTSNSTDKDLANLKTVKSQLQFKRNLG